MPRKAVGARPLTNAERSLRKRQRKASREQQLVAALEHIQSAARTLEEAQAMATSALTSWLSIGVFDGL